MFDVLLPYLVGSIIFNLTLFLVAFKFQSDKLTDISYALTFLTITLTAFILSSKSLFAVILLIMITLWAVRIGGFLLYRVIKVGKDARFDAMRSNFFSFGRFWLLQGISVWVLMVPTILALHDTQNTFGFWSSIGLVIFAAGLIIETFSDLQKMRFSNDPKNKGLWIHSGLWRFSRHPNYFGEILVWAGVYFYTLQVLNVSELLIGILSPLFISILLLFVSGIPILEKSADARWGKDAHYQRYKKSTSLLVLFPPKK